MSHLRRARLRYRFTNDHERARRLASERLVEPLAPLESEWLDQHLASCGECAAIAAAYEQDALALRSAREAMPQIPRDLWARTAAALDAEERRTSRMSSRSLQPARFGPASLAPYGVLAVAAVVAVVVGSTLLSTGAPVAPPAVTPLPSVAAIPSPVPVEAANVAWFAPQDDGTYALNIAAVADVCPAGAQGCAPVDGSSRQQLRLSAAPRAVLRSPSGSQLAVVDAATKTVGGTIYMVRLPAQPRPSTGTPSPSASVIPIARGTAATPAPPSDLPPSPPTEPAESPIASGSPPASGPVPSSGSTSQPESTSASRSAPAESAPPASPSPSPSPSSAPSSSPSGAATDGTQAIASGIVVVGETMAYSPDGASFAFTARPADGTAGTDIWVWHVGDPLARPITSDHRSVFASWLGNLVLGSRAEPESTAGTTDGTTVPASPSGTGEATSPSPEPSGSAAASSVEPTPGSSSEPASTAEPSPGGSQGESVDTSSGTSPLLPSQVGAVARPISFLLDPASGGRADLALAGWRPVVDPSGRWVVYWEGRLTLDPVTLSWIPLDGGFDIAPWAAFAGMATSDGTFVLPPLPSLPPLSDGTASDGTVTPALPSEGGSPTSSPTVLEPAGGAPSSSDVPGVGSSQASDEPTESSAPSPTGSELFSPSPTPFTLLLAPEPLPGISAGNGLGALPTDWDVRWDPSGDHLAVWVADPMDPHLGRLSLLAVDAATGRVDLDGSLLRDEPALGGISLDEGRLAWATPPGQDGQGSRLQILGWGEAGTGQLGGQPVTGEETVVVVR